MYFMNVCQNCYRLFPANWIFFPNAFIKSHVLQMHIPKEIHETKNSTTLTWSLTSSYLYALSLTHKSKFTWFLNEWTIFFSFFYFKLFNTHNLKKRESALQRVEWEQQQQCSTTLKIHKLFNKINKIAFVIKLY